MYETHQVIKGTSFFKAHLAFLIALVLFAGASQTIAQQPGATPAPQRTGRSYSGADTGKTPPPVGPQAPSPVTFTDISAQTRIAFTHAASTTSQKYLLEAM